MVNQDMDLVFWQDEEDTKGKPLKLLLCCNASQNEDWLKNQLQEFEEVGRSKNITELKKTLKVNEYINLAIIMRKSANSGVDNPEEMARLIYEHSPDAQIFIIVGKTDEIGTEIVEKTKKFGCRTLTADNGPIRAADILQEVQNLAKMAKDSFHQQETITEEKKLKVVFIEGVKGGCGQTTLMAIVGQMLKESGETVSILDTSGGMEYLNHNLEECLISKDQLPDEGWLIIDNSLVEIEDDHDMFHIILADATTESLARVKSKIQEKDLIVINRAEPTILPNEIYKGELKRDPNLIVSYRAAPYFLQEWEEIFKDWQPLLKQLLEKR